MEATTFGQRLRQAFGHAKYADIAAKIGVSEPAIKKYMAGRVPDADKLLVIAGVTNCNLHWLLTGEGPQNVVMHPDVKVGNTVIEAKLAEIAKEQAHEIFADAEVGGGAMESRTLDLLVEYLINDALVAHNLIPQPLMSKADLRRAEKFTFVKEREKSVDERIRDLAKKYAGESAVSLAKQGEFRDIILAIVRDEFGDVPGKKRAVHTLDLTKEETARLKKAG